MNNFSYKHLFFLFFTIGIASSLTAQKRKCGTESYMSTFHSHPSNIDNSESFPASSTDEDISSTTIITIPVVVHIVHKEAIENISDAQVFSQLEVLNEDFRRTNKDAADTPIIFQEVAADTKIEFCLATIGPNGLPTSGITRTLTDQVVFDFDDDIKFSNRGGIDAWDTEAYLNIWVGDLNPLLGYASLPGGNSLLDGVVLDYRAFGIVGTATAPFHLGRTATHEVGHWLNLHHIWGDGGCGLDDGVQDTPLAGASSSNESPCHIDFQNTCDEGEGDLPDMFQNYMDYTQDACMNLFTKGQKLRMRSLFMGNNTRASILSSKGCATATVKNINQNSCTDGIQNGGETAIDCGGTCPPCITVTKIPTLTQWGTLIFILLILNLSIFFLRKLEGIYNSSASSRT